MSVELIKFAFTAGEVSPTFYGRTDLEKFDLGLAMARNFFVDYRGGISTRAGFEFSDYVLEGGKDTKLFRFKFNSDIANTYVLLFGHLYVRFLQDGAYVLESGKVITNITEGNPAIVTTSAAHGYVTGDWVKIGGRTFTVGATTATTFTLGKPTGGNFDSTGQTVLLAQITVRRIYTLTTPYESTELATLTAYQDKDTIRLTATGRYPRDLIRLAHFNWTIDFTPIGNQGTPPGGLVGTSSAAGTAGFVWGVTSVDAAGVESIVSDLYAESLSVDFTATAGSYRYNWNPVLGAKYYNIYRSLLTGPNKGSQIGFVGQTTGAEFTENNIVPDFTKSPPQNYNPFEVGQVVAIDVTAGGAGYDNTTTVSVAGAPGTGFAGYPIVSTSGAIIGVVVTQGGRLYEAPVVSFSGPGAGATAVAELSPSSGTFPAISARFQQRQIYAASIQNPLTIWGSRPGRLSNFDTSPIVADNDAFEFDLDSDEVTPIRHMKAMRSGLLLMTDSGVWQLTGGQNTPVTPTNALAEPHSYTGVSAVPPIAVDTDLLYLEAKKSTVRMLAYNEFSKVYGGTDVSILSSHLFPKSNPIISWTFAEDPFKLIEAVRQDGTALAFTIVKEQNLFAWTRYSTKGIFTDIIAVQENDTDMVYATVFRVVENVFVKFIERQATRDFAHVEDSFCVDSGLRLGATYPAAAVSMSGVTGTITVTASAPVFAETDIGKVFRVGGGKGTVVGYISDTQLTVKLARDITRVRHETNPPIAQGAGEGLWTLDTPVSSVSGLWHLEGETLSVLADGSVLPPKTVVDGTIELGLSATRVVAGLPYRCIAQTLPLTTPQATIEARRKRVVGVGVRVNDTRGLRMGRTLEKLYDPKERTNEAWGEPTLLQNGFSYRSLNPRWEVDGTFYMVVDDPLPATVLGFVVDTDIGDDPE